MALQGSSRPRFTFQFQSQALFQVQLIPDTCRDPPDSPLRLLQTLKLRSLHTPSVLLPLSTSIPGALTYPFALISSLPQPDLTFVCHVTLCTLSRMILPSLNQCQHGLLQSIWRNPESSA